jgi:hypothetical protein
VTLPNIEHWRSATAYFAAVFRHWIFLFVFVAAGAVGLAQVFWTSLALPTWAWLTLAISGFVGATFLAFHDIRVDRDRLRAATEKRPVIRSTLAEARAHAEARINEAFGLSEQLLLAREDEEVAATVPELIAWNDATWVDMDAFHDDWATQFGTDGFADRSPTDRSTLEMVLSAKLARLHRLIERPWIPLEDRRPDVELPIGEPVETLAGFLVDLRKLQDRGPRSVHAEFETDGWLRDFDALIGLSERWIEQHLPASELDRYRDVPPWLERGMPAASAVDRYRHGRYVQVLERRIENLISVIRRLEVDSA